MEQLGARIKRARTARGYSQEELARLSGYSSRASINKIELGKVDPPRSKLAAIAAALHVSPTWLLGFDDEPDFVIENGDLLALIKKATPDEIRQTEQYLRMLIYARNMKDGEL